MLHRRTVFRSLFLTAAALLASCSSNEPPKSVSRSRPPTRVVPTQVAPSTAAYVHDAGAIDLLVVTESKMMLERSSTLKIREVAERLIRIHEGAAAQLSLSGRRLNLLPSATLDPGKQAMVDALSASSDPDRQYRSDMTAVHRQAIALHQKYATAGASPTLRPVASEIVASMEQALRLLSYL